MSAHKDGRRSSGILIRNNLTTDLTLDADDSTEDHNLVLDDPAAHFVDPGAFDLHLREDSAAVDMGSAEDVPAIDFDGFARPFGAAPDLGAFEWHPPLPRDGGVARDAGSGADAEPSDAGPSDAGVAPAMDGGEVDAGIAGAREDASVAAPPAGAPGGCTATHARGGGAWSLLWACVAMFWARRRLG